MLCLLTYILDRVKFTILDVQVFKYGKGIQLYNYRHHLEDIFFTPKSASTCEFKLPPTLLLAPLIWLPFS